jgi:hypothetical protein
MKNPCAEDGSSELRDYHSSSAGQAGIFAPRPYHAQVLEPEFRPRGSSQDRAPICSSHNFLLLTLNSARPLSLITQHPFGVT